MLVLINGPIASGKSTVARALAGELEAVGRKVAVIDLDLLYDMLAHPGRRKADRRTWALARRAAAALTDAFISAGIDDVIAEGDFFSPDERGEYTRHLTSSEVPHAVLLQVTYQEALRRVGGDPTRTVSRDPSFLRPYYESARSHFAHVPPGDLILKAEGRSPPEIAATIGAWLLEQPAQTGGRARAG
jgi:predicted kinase